ncbi:MAG: phenylalanine--tRNA ligase subunit beta [Chloroflexota bacterium]|nr:phenylalanine--tRNA ligase subunit beta [Chloroflexota bacterium]
MRVPLSWLSDYVTWDLSVEELAERLTLGGLEVASIDYVGEEWDRDKIFVGEVVRVREHPHADRLVLATVDYGKGEPMEVITGAPCLKVGDSGQKVVFAIEGARLIDPYADTLQYKELERTTIRGVSSAGMACSEKELGISQNHADIMILDEDAPVGEPFADYWGDVVLDLDLTPNLARCFSMVGVAREVAALTGGERDLPAPTVEAKGAPIAGQIEIKIQDPDLCPRYSAALIKDIAIGPSPKWMQRRLILAGMRPVNNIVDITNYVMWEMGQPLHAFDYRLLRAEEAGGPPTIIVRRAHPGEIMTTLDGTERTFTEEMLLITDGQGPVAVAGVMGGEDTEVTEETADILLESANFSFISVRRTSQALRLPSEASQRFGRGVDPELTLPALRRAAELMRTLADGTVAEGFADAYPNPPETRVIDFKASEVERLLGIEVPPEEVVDILTSLDFACEMLPGEPPVIRTTVPSYRLDVSIPADLVEEVARIYGYDRLPTTLIRDEMPRQGRNMDLRLEERVRDKLVGCGLTEIITYSLTNMESVANLSPDGDAPDPQDYVRLANPISVEHEYMRQTLLNTTLEAVERNLRYLERVAVFEIAHVYLPQEDERLPREPRRLSIALTGPRQERSWLTNEREMMDFYDLKGIIETLCAHLGIEDVEYAPTEHNTFQPGRVAAVSVGGKDVGVLGEVHPVVRNNYDLPEQRIALAELDLETLLHEAEPLQQFEAPSRMPALKLDMAIVIDETVPPDEVEAVIRQTGGELLSDVVLFDVYHGEQLGEGKRSLAYSLTFQSAEETLTTDQAAEQRERIAERLEEAYGAQLRA